MAYLQTVLANEVLQMKLLIIQSLWIGSPPSKLEKLCIHSFLG